MTSCRSNPTFPRQAIRSTMAVALGFLSLVLAASSQATIIASSDFDGRIVSGSTAANLTWTLNGVADPGNLTALDAPDGLFDTLDAANRFAANRNIGNEGSWVISLALSVLGDNNIALGLVTLDAFTFNNDGNLQTVGRDLDLTFRLFDSNPTELDMVTRENVYTEFEQGISQPQAVSFDFSGNTLTAGENYSLELTVFSSSHGNNAGIDNLVINGNVVPAPAPATLALLGLGLAGLGWSRRKKA